MWPRSRSTPSAPNQRLPSEDSKTSRIVFPSFGWVCLDHRSPSNIAVAAVLSWPPAAHRVPSRVTMTLRGSLINPSSVP